MYDKLKSGQTENFQKREERKNEKTCKSSAWYSVCTGRNGIAGTDETGAGGVSRQLRGRGSGDNRRGETAVKFYDSAMTADGTEVFLCAGGPALTDFCLMWKDRETGDYVTEPVVWEE